MRDIADQALGLATAVLVLVGAVVYLATRHW